MQPYCPLCGLALDRRLFTGGYRKGFMLDIAYFSVECPRCQTQVNVTQGIKHVTQGITHQTALDRVKELEERLDEIESSPDDDDVIDAEIIDVIEEDMEEPRGIEQ